MRDKYFFRRDVSQIEQDEAKYSNNFDYTGGDNRLKAYFNRAYDKDSLIISDKDQEQFTKFYIDFMKDLKQNFPKEIQEDVLNSLDSIEYPTLTTPSKLHREERIDPKEFDPKTGKGLIAVHKTNYLPNQQQIKTTANARYTRSDFDKQNFGDNPAAAVRQTIHFSLNGPVSSHMQGNWDNARYGILVPLDKILEDKIVGLRGEDTYSFGNVPLNRGGTEVIISREAYKSMSPKEISRLKKRTGAEIVTIQSDKDSKLDDTINRRIQERGYQLFDIGKDYAYLHRSFDGINLDPGNKFSGKHFYSPFVSLEGAVDRLVNDPGSGEILPIKKQFHPGNVNEARTELDQVRSLVEGSRKDGYLTRSDLTSLERQKKVIETSNPVDPEERSEGIYNLKRLLDTYRTDNPEREDYLNIDPKIKGNRISTIRKDIEQRIERDKKKRPKLPE